MVDDLGLSVPPGPSARAFGFLMAGVAAAAAAWQGLRGSGPYGIWTGAALILAGASLLQPALLEPARRAWMKLGRALAPVGNAVVLAMFFFLVVTPVAFVLRAVRRDRLGVRSPEAGTYWRAVQENDEDYSRPF
ncbi:MAG: hypothetical protein FIA95_16085 [Gemmatimonadetes bacterium]|nr:hypothetical protein [Gemmatimonadota bacterium]